mgnify:CR=1 FL=1
MHKSSPRRSSRSSVPRRSSCFVDSAVARLVPRDASAVGIADHRRFGDVVRAAFGQRRKTLRNALGGTCSTDQIEAAGLRPDARAEQIEVEGFVRLANLPAEG